MKALVIGTCFLMLCVAASADSYFGYGGYYGLSSYNGDNLWRTSVNWSASPAVDGANTWIGDGYGYGAFGRDCIIDATTIAVDDYTNVGYQASSLGNLTMTGGSFNTDHCNLGANGTGTFTMGGGIATMGGDVRLGQYGGTGVFKITGGTFTTPIMNASFDGAGTIKVYGGTLAVLNGFYLNSTNTVEIKGVGTMTWGGDHKGTLDYWYATGQIFTTDAGKTVDIAYDSNAGKTIVTVIPEPATLTMLAAGFAMLARKRKN